MFLAPGHPFAAVGSGHEGFFGGSPALQPLGVQATPCSHVGNLHVQLIHGLRDRQLGPDLEQPMWGEGI